MESNKIFIDLRGVNAFLDGHASGSYCIELNEKLEIYLSLLEEDLPLCFVIFEQQQTDPLFKNKCLAISKDFLIWESQEHKEIDMCIAIDTEEFKLDYEFDEFFLIDVRSAEDFAKGSLEHAESLPIDELTNSIVDLDTDQTYYIFGDDVAQVGFAASIFKRHGFHAIRLVSAPYELLKVEMR